MFKVGDKVTRIWNDNVDVKQGKTYTIKKQHRFGVSLEETGEALYSAQGFKLVEDDMKIKITKWEDLNGKENSKYQIQLNVNYIEVYQNKNENLVVMIFIDNEKDIIIDILKAFEFQIEFTEPIKLTKEEWHQVRVFNSGWIKKDTFEGVETHWYPNKPCGYNTGLESVPSHLFSFMKPDIEEWSIESLRQLECEEEV